MLDSLDRVQIRGDVELLRLIRNEVRGSLQHTDWIGPYDQEKWWAAAPREAWLARKGQEVAGFANIQREEGRSWITLGVRPKFQGQGLGTLIYGSFSDMHALIRDDNVASRRAAEKAGYVKMLKIPGWVILYRD